MKYATELQKTMIPGTLTWNDAGNNQAYCGRQISLTFNGVSIYYVAEELARPDVAGYGGGHLPSGRAVGPLEVQPESAAPMNAWFSSTASIRTPRRNTCAS